MTRNTNEYIDAFKGKTHQELLEILDVAVKANKELIRKNPFYGYEPNDGLISADQMQFLLKYLKEDDIPQKLDSQLDVHKSVADIMLTSGGNQSGKSTCGCIEDAIQATGEVPFALDGIYPVTKLPVVTPQRIRVVGVSAGQLVNTVLPTYQHWIPRQFLKKNNWADSFSSEHKRLHLFKGKTEIASIEFKTNEQEVETFQGVNLHKCTFDEEPKQSIWKENLMRFVTSDRLRMQINWTPTKGLTWASDLVMKDQDEFGHSIERFQLCTVSNPRANLKSLTSLLSQITSYDELKMRLLGEFISLSGLVYGRLFNRGIHVIPPFWEDLAPSHKRDFVCRIGIDPHENTPTAAVFLITDRDGNCYVDTCYMGERGDMEVTKKDIVSLIKYKNYRVYRTVVDKSATVPLISHSGLSLFDILRKSPNGIPACITSDKSWGAINAGVDVIKQYLKVNELTQKPRLYICNRPENKGLIDSFLTMERDSYANEDFKGEKDAIREGKHHFHAALRYIFQYPISWFPESIILPKPRYHDKGARW